MRVVSIGDLVTDYYYKNGKLLGINGGMTSHNIIANLAKMGIKTAVFGVCGNDVQGEMAIKSLKKLDVDVSNIKILDDVRTRCFHVSYFDDGCKLSFTSKKRCPFCNNKKWYEDSLIDTDDIITKINNDDILVFDNLNNRNQILIDKVANKQVVILDIASYERVIPEEVANAMIKVKDLFDEFYIVCTDYNSKLSKQVQKERREKDPILFGAFLDRDKQAINERFYYIGDWVDEYCDLTLDKMVAEMQEANGKDIINEIPIVPIPSTDEELKEKKSFFDKIKTFLNKKND